MTFATRHHHRGEVPEPDLARLIDGWLSAGVISPDQAGRMLSEHHPADHGAARSTSVALEAVGYLGGALVVVAALLIGASYWGDLSTGIRLATVGAIAAGLLGAAVLVSGLGPAGSRLASVLCLASTAAVSGFLAISIDTIALAPSRAVLIVSGGTACYAALLWAWRRGLLQQVTVAVALMSTAAGAIADRTSSDALPGLGIWGVAGVWLVLGWRGSLVPRRVVMTMAAAAMVIGVLGTLPARWGFAIAFLTIALLVALAVRLRELPLLVVAAIGALQVLPAAVVEWYSGSALAAFVLLAAGVVMIGCAVWAARRGARRAGVTSVAPRDEPASRS